jgi:glycosyltransferase involved in cell wall biosynthesis
MVHGDVREERLVLEREAETSPEYFRLYLGDGALDLEELDWLHERRLQELQSVDRVLVPSEHIASELVRHGTPRSRIRVIPYAADTQRFRPDSGKTHGPSCTFLFAGGISQRKGIRYLLEAWKRIRRPGWKLQLLGALPRELGPIREHLDSVEILGRVAHSDVPAIMAAADVFVFPSLFEGSAVVTYEALACGLPSIVTPSAGSIVRDGIDGFIVLSGNSEELALRMVHLGEDPGLRSSMAVSARERAEQFDWPRYHESIREVMCDLLG